MKRSNFKKFIILALALHLCFSNAVLAKGSDIEAQLSQIEISIWGFDYPKEKTQDRLKRIEGNVFGLEVQDKNEEQRVQNLNQALGFESQEEQNSSLGELMQEELEGVSYPQVDKLELALFKKVYDKEAVYKRIERLEKELFGEKQEGDLASRTDRLKGYLDTEEQNQNDYIVQDESGDYSAYYDEYTNDMGIQLSGLEQLLFKKTYSNDPTALRLNRLEREIFDREFSQDSNITRMERLEAASSANRTSKHYDQNRFQKFASTGVQIGTIVLMILAMLL